jgi:hypothetical protein
MSQTADSHNVSKNFSTEILNNWNFVTYVLKERIPLNFMPIKVIELLAERQWDRIWHLEDHASWYILIIKADEMHYFSTLFGKELYKFWTDLLSIIRSLNTVFTAIGICHTEILKMGKITSVHRCTL